VSIRESGAPRSLFAPPVALLSREECEAIVMQARLKAGWITEADLAPAAAEEAPAEAAPAQ